MAKRITDEQIIQINEEYLIDPVKSHVAKKLGISASTVSKYLIKNYVSQSCTIIEKTNYKLPPIEEIRKIFDFSWGDLCILSDEEKQELKELQKSIMV